MRIAFLIGSDPSALMSMEAVCRVQGIQPTLAIVDSQRPAFRQRVTTLMRAIGHKGVGHLGRSLLWAAADAVNRLAERITPYQSAQDLLRRAFPDRAFTLAELAARHRFPIVHVNDVNGPEAAAALLQSETELGIVFGTRLLNRATYTIPALGCINLHHGQLPEYRGAPPGFWEIYDRADKTQVSVHFIDDGLNTGDVIVTASIPIHVHETERSLRTKMNLEGARLLAASVSQLQSGTAVCVPQAPLPTKLRGAPTQAQRRDLARRYSRTVNEKHPLKEIAKTTLYLAFYYLGLYSWVRRRARSRARVILYHRVNNFSSDALTTSVEDFACHLATLANYYRVRDTAWLIDRLRNKAPIPSETVAIHFDDCYRDVFLYAAPLLKAAGMPALCFIATGFIGTDRSFEHDLERYPFRYDNLTREDVAALPSLGLCVGAHTINHVNLADVPTDVARHEILVSQSDLEALTGQPVKFFSFPFGEINHIRPEVRDIVREARFDALFSAHGGSVTSRTDPYDVPRMGVSSEHRPLSLLMELENLSIGHLWPFGKKLSKVHT